MRSHFVTKLTVLALMLSTFTIHGGVNYAKNKQCQQMNNKTFTVSGTCKIYGLGGRHNYIWQPGNEVKFSACTNNNLKLCLLNNVCTQAYMCNCSAIQNMTYPSVGVMGGTNVHFDSASGDILGCPGAPTHGGLQ